MISSPMGRGERKALPRALICWLRAGAPPPLAHVLVATDAAVRGIDVPLPAGLALLVSYDCPTRKVRLPRLCASSAGVRDGRRSVPVKF